MFFKFLYLFIVRIEIPEIFKLHLLYFGNIFTHLGFTNKKV